MTTKMVPKERKKQKTSFHLSNHDFSTWNHRTYGGKDLWKSSGPTPCSQQDFVIRSGCSWPGYSSFEHLSPGWRPYPSKQAILLHSLICSYYISALVTYEHQAKHSFTEGHCIYRLLSHYTVLMIPWWYCSGQSILKDNFLPDYLAPYGFQKRLYQSHVPSSIHLSCSTCLSIPLNSCKVCAMASGNVARVTSRSTDSVHISK